MGVARFYNRQCIRSQCIWKRYIKEATAQLSEESDNVSNINLISDSWQIKSLFKYTSEPLLVWHMITLH